MDGNGRWAKQRFAAYCRHKAGADTVREIVRACGERKIEALTLFASVVRIGSVRPKKRLFNEFICRCFRA